MTFGFHFDFLDIGAKSFFQFCHNFLQLIICLIILCNLIGLFKGNANLNAQKDISVI